VLMMIRGIHGESIGSKLDCSENGVVSFRWAKSKRNGNQSCRVEGLIRSSAKGGFKSQEE